MRTIFLRCAAAGLALFLVWAFGSRRLSLLLDRWVTLEISKQRVFEIAYTGGGIYVPALKLGLTDTDLKNEKPVTHLNDGSNRFVLVYRGLSYPLGTRLAPPDRSGNPSAALQIDAGDEITVTEGRSLLAWPTFFHFSVMNDTPDYRRHSYYTLAAQKTSGAKLVMKWRYEQRYYPATGWTQPAMGYDFTTGLLSVEITEGNSEEIAAQYIAGAKGWKVIQYRLERREPKEPHLDEIAVIYLDDEAGRSPGAGKSMVLTIDRNSRKVIKETGAQ